MRTVLLTASLVAALGLAAFAQQNPQNPQNPQTPPQPQPNPQTPSVSISQEREVRIGSDKSVNAQQAAEMLRYSKHSLSDSISTAERQCNGKAVAAHCCVKSVADITYLREKKAWPAGQPDIRRGGTPSGTNEQKRDAQGEDTPDRSRTVVVGEEGPVCIVTCLVGDNRLVELVVCSKSNQVLADRPIDSVGSAYSSTAIEK